MLDIIATVLASLVMWSLNARITMELLEKDKEDQTMTKLTGVLTSCFLLGIIVWAIWS
jgi:hypothetical protein